MTYTPPVGSSTTTTTVTTPLGTVVQQTTTTVVAPTPALLTLPPPPPVPTYIAPGHRVVTPVAAGRLHVLLPSPPAVILQSPTGLNRNVTYTTPGGRVLPGQRQ